MARTRLYNPSDICMEYQLSSSGHYAGLLATYHGPSLLSTLIYWLVLRVVALAMTSYLRATSVRSFVAVCMGQWSIYDKTLIVAIESYRDSYHGNIAHSLPHFNTAWSLACINWASCYSMWLNSRYVLCTQYSTECLKEPRFFCRQLEVRCTTWYIVHSKVLTQQNIHPTTIVYPPTPGILFYCVESCSCRGYWISREGWDLLY